MRATLLSLLTFFTLASAHSLGLDPLRPRAKRQSASYTAVIAFGGSYSDNGHARTTGTLPGAPYVGGRKTNGAVAVEYLATAQSAQLRNYAYAGAQIDNSLVSGTVPATKDQVATFIADVNSGAFVFGNGHTLISFYAGIESLISIWTTAINAGNTAAAKSAAAAKVTAHVNALLGQIQTLRGQTPNCATDYILMTVPPLEVVLQVAYQVNYDGAKLNTMSTLEMQFNTELVAGAAGLVKPFSKVTVVAYRDFWYDAQYNPSKYGLTQGTTACYTGSGSACASPASYLYFDSLNPTTAFHRQLADKMLAALGLPLTASPSSPPPAPSSTSTSRASSSSSTRSSASSTPSATSTPAPTPLTGYWPGANSYYLFALQDADRIQVLNALAGAGMKVVRIFIGEIPANHKGSGNPYVPDLEPQAVGTYDDTILVKIDQLMLECSQRGMRLLIALHDRYSLAYWSTDAYAYKYGIAAPGSGGVQKISNADAFYTNSNAVADFDNRIRYIMAHRNALLGNKPWAQLDSVIYAIEAENEPQGHMDSSNPGWMCGRSAVMRSTLPSNSIMLISSGGGVDRPTSLASWAVDCASMQIVSVHSYDLADLQNTIASAKNLVQSKGKTIIVGEYGALGSNKASQITNVKNAVRNQGVPQMYWEVVKPGNLNDYEVWTDEPSWAALTS